ncbi:MAG TPA: hypothetical protein VNO21_15105 [Polyangiaceae bacterium]|nr:hypothetical protein [Polyangiaceae bacterium]
MKVITYDRFRPGVTMETIQPLLSQETAHAWRLWKQGIIRENYSRVDEPGVVIVLEVENVEAAKRILHDFPMTKAGFIEWFYLPVTVPFPLEAMFNDASLERVKMPDSELEWSRGQTAR